MDTELSVREKYNKIIGAVIVVAGLVGLYFGVEYSGWALAVGFILIL